MKERYVNLEVAKLLRDKGFNEECYKTYNIDTGQMCIGEEICNTELTKISGLITAPTQQIACDWLQTKDVLITYDLAPVGTTLMVKVYKKTYDLDFPWTEGITIIRSTLEDAINDSLKYALTNLI